MEGNMREGLAAAVIAVSLLAAPVAFADCVNYSAARAEAERQAARRTPLTAEELGVPTLNGLERDYQSLGDPSCGGSLVARGPNARFTLTVSFREFVTAIHPYIKRVTERDGMGREWYKNPLVGDRIVLTSGAQLDFIGGRSGGPDQKNYALVLIKPARPASALTTDSQPYSINDIVNWTPWVGGQRGNFVQVGAAAAPPQSGNAQRAATPQNTATPQAPTTASNTQSCPPAQSSGSANGANIGADIGGAVLGGGFGRNVGGALGGLFGGGQPKQPQPTNTAQCPHPR
jgi:hypothetical protein